MREIDERDLQHGLADSQDKSHEAETPATGHAEFVREDRYVVWKAKDIANLSKIHKEQLAEIANNIAVIRAERGHKKWSA